MRKTDELLNQLGDIASNPGAALEAVLASGKKAVGILPYFAPEELVDAAGLVPFGVWGAQLQASEAKRYFPAFICSLLQTALELGIRGKLDGLSAIIAPLSCDSLKCFGPNWKAAVKSVPVIEFAFAQNRKIDAGVQFTVSQYEKVAAQLAEITGAEISKDAVAKSVAKYNANRAALREFSALAATHPQSVSPKNRSAVIKAGYFMDRAEHTALVSELCEALRAIPDESWDGLRVVTSGILADAPQILEIFAENKIAIVADQVAHESVSFNFDTPVTENPLTGMAERLGAIEGCSVLFDLGKKRASGLAELAAQSKADGVIFVQSKFCDPDEFDYPIAKAKLDERAIPMLQIEYDQQAGHFEQIKSAVLAFCEVHGS